MNKSIFAVPLLALFATTSQAAIVQHDFWLFDNNGDLLTNDGVLGYDDDNLSPFGLVTLTPIEGVSIEFSLNGVTFATENDIDFNEFPQLSFRDGFLFELDLFLVQGVNGTDFGGSGITRIAAGPVTFSAQENAFFIDADVNRTAPSPVPLPAGLPLAAAGLGALAMLRRKQRKSA